MKAVVITRPGGPEVLELRELPPPKPSPDEVLVRVRAAGLNRADLLQRAGKYPAPPGAPADIPGMEFAGEVAETGDRVRRWRKGQRVLGLVGGGAYAEYVVAHEGVVSEIPAALSWSEAAAIPEAFITAQDAMSTQAQLKTGERVLIHAVGSGVGLAAVQLARAIGAQPYGTSRTADKIERARAFGLEDGVVVGKEIAELVPAVKRWTDGGGFDVALDLAGGPYVGASIAALGARGRLMLIATVAGARAEMDLPQVLGKRLRIMGTVMRSRSLQEKIAVNESFARDVLPLFARGALRAALDREFPLDQAAQAHAFLEGNQSFGKVVLVIG